MNPLISTGLVTTFSFYDSSLHPYEIADESKFPPNNLTGIFVSEQDFNIGCFYCTVGNEVRYNTYKDKILSATCIFHNTTQMVAQQIAQQLIQVNNTEYITNFISNTVNNNVTTQLTQVLGQDYTSNFADIATQLNSLNLNYNTLMQEEASNHQSEQTATWNNSQAIASLQQTVSQLVTIIQNMTILNIADKSFKSALI